MAGNIEGSPLFAGRYRFQSVDEDWDTGRTGFTHLAYDIQENRTVVIKRADVTSPQSRQHEHSLQNESRALEKLKGLGVPKLFDVNQAVYGNQKFTYLVMEYIDGMRVEKEISFLEPIERARILLELFRLLAKSHHRGIANGDIDLKHLFWFGKEKKITVIDWGNASITYPQRNDQLSFDIARSAEIIYALVVQDSTIPVTGSLALPEKEKLLADLLPLPEEFYKLCKWAPRNPSEDVNIPFTALDMFAVTQKWVSNLDPGERYSDAELDELIAAKHQTPNSQWPKMTIGIISAIIVFFVATISLFTFYLRGNLQNTPVISASENFQETVSPTIALTLSPTSTSTSTMTPSGTETPIKALTPTTTSRPPQYSKIVGFDSNLPFNFKPTPCWTTSSTSGNFGKRSDGQWQFQVDKNYDSNDPIKSDFNECFDGKKVSAIGLNFWIQRLAVNSEFGIYIEDHNGSAREYVFRTDVTDNTAHIMVRDGDGNFIDYLQLSIKPKLEGDFPSQYYQFSAKLFLALNDQGNNDVIYFSPGSDLQPSTTDTININLEQMKRVDVRPSLGDIQSIGLIGNGPEIQILIWPLVFYEDIAN